MKKYNPKSLMNLRKPPKGVHYSPTTEFKKGQHTSTKTEFKKGFVPWNKNKKGVMPPSWMKGKTHSLEAKRKIKEARAKQVFSKESIAKAALKRKGVNHWNWKGGITPENIKIRQSLEYVIWRNEVWERDHWTCRICGYKGKSIIAHHVKLFSGFPELRFVTENGLTLCRKCHLEIHGGVAKIRWKKQ